MKPIQHHTYAPIDGPARDGPEQFTTRHSTHPHIVSVSDVHGYLDELHNSLLTLTDHPDYAPVVTAEGNGQLHWTDNNYVLVFNGDLVDRGPANEKVLKLVSRLAKEAPPGRVRVTLGNHEAIALSAEHFNFQNWYAGAAENKDRLALMEAIRNGLVVTAYEGYNVTYVHAGSPEPFEVKHVNDALVNAVNDLRTAVDTSEDAKRQQAVLDEYPQVLGVGEGHPKGPEAGMVWLDFEYLPEHAPPQVVGHTRFRTPQRKGDVFCQNVIRKNLDSAGGEAVFVESPDSLEALIRRDDGSVTERPLWKP